jgi:hypothetical protein
MLAASNIRVMTTRRNIAEDSHFHVSRHENQKVPVLVNLKNHHQVYKSPLLGSNLGLMSPAQNLIYCIKLIIIISDSSMPTCHKLFSFNTEKM